MTQEGIYPKIDGPLLQDNVGPEGSMGPPSPVGLVGPTGPVEYSGVGSSRRLDDEDRLARIMDNLVGSKS
jgi:hypothetical protein